MEEHKEKKERHAKGAGETEIKITVPEIKGISWSTVTTAAAIILLVIVAFQAYQAWTLTQKINAMEAKAAEQNRLPTIEVTAIEPDCAQCTPLAEVLAAVNSAKANITKILSLKPDAENSGQLISKYGIKRLPTVILTGEIDKLKLSDAGFEPVGDALVYAPQPPYADAATGAVKGLVTITIVNASGCTECTDLMPAAKQLRILVAVKEVKVVDKDSAEGKELIEKYTMARLPAILISNDIGVYPIASQIANTGAVKQDGTIAVGANPPYFNASTGKVDGIASLILLNDSSCSECYDVAIHIPIVKMGFQVYISSTRTVDSGSAEGKSMISKYGITAVPTILLAGDLAPYARLNAIWKTVGTVESDGTYVFRNMSAIAGMPYMNTATGKVEPNAAAQPAATQPPAATASGQ